MTDDSAVASVAVPAARLLAAEFRLPRLPLDVEAALGARGAVREQQQLADPVALASLIVSVAGLAWQIYGDLKKEGGKATRDTLIRLIQVRRREGSGANRAEERIIEVVVDETIKAAGDDG